MGNYNKNHDQIMTIL